MAAAIATHRSVLSIPNILTALTYTVNYCQHGHHILGHLWSLGVEEQFYLIWPLTLILFYRRRLWIVAAVVLAGPPLRILFWLTWGAAGLNHPFPVFMDALAMGSAVAMLERIQGPKLESKVKKCESFLASRWALFIPGMTALLPLLQLWNTRVYQVAGLSLLHLGIVLSIKHVMQRRYLLLNAWPVLWLGAISYSLYLWQQMFLSRGSTSPWMAFPQNLALSILLSTVSYHLVERPFLLLRERWTRTVAKRSPIILDANASPTATMVA